jgi:outer membrane immunogenic protein
MRKTFAAGIAVFCSMSLTADAADLSGASLKDAPVAYGPAHSWAGLYVGGSAGFAKGDLSEARTMDVLYEDFYHNQWSESHDWESASDFREAIYGAHIGYNLQFGRIVAGLEAAINGMNLEDCTGACSGWIQTKLEVDWYATAVARLGYAEGNWLLYGFGGVAWASADVQVRDNLPRSVFPAISPDSVDIHGGKSDHVGWTAGLGVEYALSERLSVRAEYSHVDLGEETISLGSYNYPSGSFSESDKVDLSFDTVKVGASYKLFGPESALDALK